MSGQAEGESATTGRNSPLRVDIPPVPKDLNGVSVSNTLADVPSSPPRSPTASSNAKNLPLSRSDLYDGSASSWSASSDKQLGSPGSYSDRVFPIRSVVRVDTSQTPYNLPGQRSGEGLDYFASTQVSAGTAAIDHAGTPSSLSRQANLFGAQ
jgi:hypothetical protein